MSHMLMPSLVILSVFLLQFRLTLSLFYIELKLILVKAIDQSKPLNSIKKELATIVLYIQSSKRGAGNKCYAAVEYFFFYCKAYGLAATVMNKV